MLAVSVKEAVYAPSWDMAVATPGHAFPLLFFSSET